jgi:hypothetical protein
MHEESYNGEIPLVCSGWDRVSKGHELSEELQGERGLVSLTFSLIMPKNVVSQNWHLAFLKIYLIKMIVQLDNTGIRC